MLTKALGAFFAIMNPLVNLPLFLSLTTGYTQAQQRKTAVQVVLYSAMMAAVIIASGAALLHLFGITVDDFRVAGGIVLLMIALGMLNGGSAVHSGNSSEQTHQSTQATEGDVSFYPMTFPIIMGPGTITTIIVLTSRGDSIGSYLTVALAAGVILLLLLVVLWFASSIGHHLSQTLRVIMTRLMGMILAGIAVQMIVAGLGALLPGLAK